MRPSLFGLLLIGIACATTPTATSNSNPGDSTTSPFTTEAQLQTRLSGAAPTDLFATDVAAIDSFTLDGTLPTVAGHAPHPQTNPFEKHVVEKTQGQVPTAADVACVARLTAEIVMKHHAKPPRALARYLAGRCGVTAPSVETVWVNGKPEGQTNDQLAAAWAEKIDARLLSIRSGTVVGTGFARNDDDAVWVLAWVRDQLELDDVKPIPVGGTVVLTGQVPSEIETLDGFVNLGAFAAATCAHDVTDALPKFKLTCKPLVTDAEAWISVWGREKGRLRGTELARVLALPAGPTVAGWKRPTRGSVAPTPEGLLKRINNARTQVGWPELTVSAPQSAETTALAPHFFSAVHSGDFAEQDALLLGVMAGWKIETPIVHGESVAGWTERADESELYAALMESPHTRAMLTSPLVQLASVGLAVDKGAGAVVGVYRQLPALSASDANKKVIADLNGARGRRGVTAVNWVIPEVPVDPELLDKVSRGDKRPDAALDQMNEIVTKSLKATAQGWVVFNDELAAIPFPAPLLTEESISIWVVTVPYRAPGQPWRSWAVMLEKPEGALKHGGNE